MPRKNPHPTKQHEQEDAAPIASDEKADVGRKIRRVRDDFGFTLDQLSEATKQIDSAGAGVSKVSISRYENGDSYPGYRELKLIALAMGTPITFFFYGDSPDPYGDWNVSLDEFLRGIVRDELREAGLIPGVSMRQKDREKMQAMQDVAARRRPFLSPGTSDLEGTLEAVVAEEKADREANMSRPAEPDEGVDRVGEPEKSRKRR